MIGKFVKSMFDPKLGVRVCLIKDVEMMGAVRRAKARASKVNEAVVVYMFSAKCISAAGLL